MFDPESLIVLDDFSPDSRIARTNTSTPRKSNTNGQRSRSNSPEQQNTNENNMTSSQNAAVTVQKIAFWSANPAAWFRVIEAQFVAARITDEVTRFNHVISMLDAETINKCMDILETIPTSNPYTDFRDRVISRLSASEQSRAGSSRYRPRRPKALRVVKSYESAGRGLI